MTRLIVVLACALACTPAALAQKKMYRCGNQFQERPCEGPKADAAATSAKADPQKQQETAAKREEREQAIRVAKCENYTEELGDITKRINAGADDKVIDQFMRRQKEMKTRIARECK